MQIEMLVPGHRRPPVMSERIESYNWPAKGIDLDRQGWTLLEHLITNEEADMVADLYATEDGFRSRVVMQNVGFGKGEYRYLAYPLPPLIQALREAIYPKLAPIANDWNRMMRSNVRYPREHCEFLDRCHEAGQTRPTPLILQYGPGDYNRLHQDLYGENVFPIQVAILLSEPGAAFTGGEFVLTEQAPRMQTRAAVVPLRKGDAVVFSVARRPVFGAGGQAYQVNMRHGVSEVRSGIRHTVGIIFHDAK